MLLRDVHELESQSQTLRRFQLQSRRSVTGKVSCVRLAQAKRATLANIRMICRRFDGDLITCSNIRKKSFRELQQRVFALVCHELEELNIARLDAETAASAWIAEITSAQCMHLSHVFAMRQGAETQDQEATAEFNKAARQHEEEINNETDNLVWASWAREMLPRMASHVPKVGPQSDRNLPCES